MPFPLDSAIWGITKSPMQVGPGSNSSYDVYYYTSGDTIINNLNYTKILNYSYPLTFEKYLREDANKRVYCLYPGQNEHLLYDFNLSLNDTIDIPGPDFNNDVSCLVVNIDSIQIDNGFRRRYILVELNFDGWGVTHDWVEGIGSMNQGLFYPDLPWVDNSAWIKCLSHKNENIWGGGCILPVNITQINPNLESSIIYPNPTKGKLTITCTQSSTCNVFNLLGQSVYQVDLLPGHNTLNLSFLPPGNYFVSLRDTKESKITSLVLR